VAALCPLLFSRAESIEGRTVNIGQEHPHDHSFP